MTNKAPFHFPVVGIGAAQGGLEPIRQLVDAIQENSGMAYLLLCDLCDSEHANFAEIFSTAKLPVSEIISEITIVPDNIYIVPSNHAIIFHNGKLKLYRRTRSDASMMALDRSFESLLQIFGHRTVGVVLSGNGFDGSAGLKKIREAGGATIAQTPETAIFPSMPQNAIDANAVDYVVQPHQIPETLLRINEIFIAHDAFDSAEPGTDSESEFIKESIQLISLRTGTNFHHYRHKTIRQRVAQRMVTVKKSELADYLNFLKGNKTEQDKLFDSFLIPITYFFRDPEVFETLSETLLPKVIQNLSNNNLRIWVAGCSTGEEAYSVAICVHDYLLRHEAQVKVQIFATDLSAKGIALARKGVYNPRDVQNIPVGTLETYFVKKDGHYHISKEIREMCVFAIHDLTENPPFAKIDLVSCRNVLKYFDDSYRHKVLAAFQYALKANGVLFLGKSELETVEADLFGPFGESSDFYLPKVLPSKHKIKTNPSEVIKRSAGKRIGITNTTANNGTLASHFSKYVPAGVIINSHQDIIHFEGDTSPFLLSSTGKPDLNIYQMIRPELEFDFRTALREAIKNHEPHSVEKTVVGHEEFITKIEIERVGVDNFLILFRKAAASISEPKQKISKSSQNRVAVMQQEMDQWRTESFALSQERELAFEELQTTNEELLSSGEEMLAVNEELEQIGQELISKNEELNCLNHELKNRQQQLISEKNYSDSIVNTMQEPLIVIDEKYRIQNVNPTFYKFSGASEHDIIGKSLLDLGNFKWNVAEVENLLKKVVSGEQNLEDFLVKADFTKIGKRSMLLNARRVIDTLPSLVLITFNDITDKVTAHEQMATKNRELELYNAELRAFTSAASHDLQEPLRKTLMFTNMIIDDDKSISENSRYALGRIIVSIEHMQKMIRDLINYSKSNLAEPAYKNTDLGLIIRKSVDELKRMTAAKEARISIGLFPEVKAQPEQLKQLFTSLITNAIAYSREDVKPEIAIDASRAEPSEIETFGGNPSAKYIKVTISDNGQGFGESYADRIFDPFFRLHSKDKIPGSGLGLTLCKKIMYNHRGFIKATGKPNEGCTMNLYFPT